MENFFQKLKTTQADAQARKNRAQSIALQLTHTKEELEAQRLEIDVKLAMLDIKEKCLVAADNDLDCVLIKELTHYGKDQDIREGKGSRKVLREHLSPLYQRIHDELIALSLKPIYKFNHDDGGIESWYDFYVSWEDNDGKKA